MLKQPFSIEALDVSAYQIPTDAPESDGTLKWDSTTLVLVELHSCGHTAPALHMHPGCCAASVRHLEYFHDHARIESMLFDGRVSPDEHGNMAPDMSQPGLGLTFKCQEAQSFKLSSIS